MEVVFADLVTTPTDFLFDSSKRIYWLYLLSSLVIASFVISRQTGKWQPIAQLRRLFNTRYWFATSSFVDYFLLFFNNATKILLLIPLFGSHLALTIFVGSSLLAKMESFGKFGVLWVFINGFTKDLPAVIPNAVTPINPKLNLLKKSRLE